MCDARSKGLHEENVRCSDRMRLRSILNCMTPVRSSYIRYRRSGIRCGRKQRKWVCAGPVFGDSSAGLEFGRLTTCLHVWIYVFLSCLCLVKSSEADALFAV